MNQAAYPAPFDPITDMENLPGPPEGMDLIRSDFPVTNNETPGRKPWMKRPGAPIVKVAPDVKRRRKNYQVKKLLTPKNPLMILNELKPGITFTFPDSNEANSAYFEALVELDGHTFSGKGVSKKQAQQDAAEAALRGLYFHKLLEQLSKSNDDVEMKDADSQIDGTDKSQSHPEDDTPWGGLASLAMYKLVTFWQNSPNGHSAPMQLALETKAPVSSNSDFGSKLPPNASDLDPVMLLNQISPHSKFTEQSRDVRSGSTMFTISVDFNGNKYSGTAAKKKMAKKICAKAALQGIGVVYNESNV